MLKIHRMGVVEVDDHEDGYPSGYIPVRKKSTLTVRLFGLKIFQHVEDNIQNVTVYEDPSGKKKSKRIGFVTAEPTQVQPTGTDTDE